MVRINDDVIVPDEELTFEMGRGGGPGGQNVNKVSTRVSLLFDIAHSAGLTEVQKKRILSALGSRVSKDGILRLTASQERTQGQNRRIVIERFIRLLRAALIVPRRRVPTRPTRGSRERRLDAKKRRSAVKRDRSRRRWD